MSLLEAPSARSRSSLQPDEFEDAFIAWIHDPARPDMIEVGSAGPYTMVDLAQRLTGSQIRLGPVSAPRLGLCPDATLAAAARALLHATVDPDGPRCRSFRAAGLYLRGLARLELDESESPPTDRVDGTADATSRAHS
jgi:hypothetical protein